jgi:hypothetical protein
MSDHIKYLGIATIVFHLFLPLIIIFLVPLVVGAAALAGDAEASLALGGVMTVVTIIVMAIALPGIIAGIGLIKRKRWSRIVAMIANAFHILNLPFGTALGVYTFWVLTKDEAIAQLEE